MIREIEIGLLASQLLAWKERQELPPKGLFIAQAKDNMFHTLKHLEGGEPEFKKWNFKKTAIGFLKNK